jgi:hypothetical protein
MSNARKRVKLRGCIQIYCHLIKTSTVEIAVTFMILIAAFCSLIFGRDEGQTEICVVVHISES